MFSIFKNFSKSSENLRCLLDRTVSMNTCRQWSLSLIHAGSDLLRVLGGRSIFWVRIKIYKVAWEFGGKAVLEPTEIFVPPLYRPAQRSCFDSVNGVRRLQDIAARLFLRVGYDSPWACSFRKEVGDYFSHSDCLKKAIAQVCIPYDTVSNIKILVLIIMCCIIPSLNRVHRVHRVWIFGDRRVVYVILGLIFIF